MINRTVVFLSAALMLVMAHQQAVAESCDAEKQDLAYTFTSLGQWGEAYDQIAQDAVSSQKGLIGQQANDSTSQAKIRLLLALMQEEMMARKSDYIYMIADVVCSTYTKAELTDMIGFFDSDSGQSFMEKSSLIQDQVVQATRQFANEALQDSFNAANQRLGEEEPYTGL